MTRGQVGWGRRPNGQRTALYRAKATTLCWHRDDTSGPHPIPEGDLYTFGGRDGHYDVCPHRCKLHRPFYTPEEWEIRKAERLEQKAAGIRAALLDSKPPST